MDYSLRDLLDLPQLRLLLDSWGRAHNSSAVVLDLDGNPLAGTPVVQVGCGPQPGGARKSHPIIIAGKLLGSVDTGQLSPEAAGANQSGPAPRDGLDQGDQPYAVPQAPAASEQTPDRLGDFLATLVQSLAEQESQRLREAAIAGNRRENESIFRSLFENAKDPILLLNCGRFIDCNAATLELLGYQSKPELLERSPGDISPELQPDGRPSREKAAEMIATALRLGYHQFEWLHSRADGTCVPVEVTLTPVSIGGELILHTLWRDLTERKQAEDRIVDAMNYIQTILSTSPVGIETFKATGETVSANEAAARIVGAKIDRLVRQNFRTLESWRHSGLLEIAERALATGLEQRGDFHVLTSFGERVDLDCLFVPFMFSGEQHLMLTIMDVSQRKQAEQGLLYSISLVDAAFESTADGILVVDLNGKIARWNQKFLDLWKIPEEMIAAHDDVHVLSHNLAQMAQPAQFLAKVAHLYQHPEESSEDLLVLADGRLFDRYSQPLRIGNEITGRFWSFRDNTERRKLEEEVRRELEQMVSERTKSLEDANCELLASNSELELRRNEAEATNKKLRQLSSAVENSSTAIVITDCLGRIEYVNPKFCEITGYSQEEIIGANPRILNAGRQPKELYRELWATISAGRAWCGDFCNLKKNGDLFWEHASISPIRSADGQITNFVAVKEDITEQKRVAGELSSAQEAALAANRAKSEFLANMSHEIRTPLSAIIGFSDLTLRTSLQPRQQDYLQKIQTAGDLLLSIINDILDFSKIEARQLEMEQIPFRLDTILANVTDIVQQKVNQKRLQLRVATEGDVALDLVGDQHRLSQILVNLLNNAVKFTETGGVSLETTLQKRLPGRVKLKFTVRDTGIGISDELLKKLFQPFTQADGSTTRRFGGTGLGLSISKQLVQLMDGEIWCESRSEQGSTFCFTAWFGAGVPGGTARGAPAEATGRDHDEAGPDFSGSRILLVEDNAVNMELASELLHGTGTTVEHAADGRKAVTMICSGGTHYDLVLMDLQMPVMDGYQAARLIRSDSRFSELPIVAMTADAMKEVQQAILEAGMSAIVTKPINAATLLRVIGSLLRAQPVAGNPGAAADNGTGPSLREAAGGLGGSPGREPAAPPCDGTAQPVQADLSLVSPILNQLLHYIKGSNGKAERYLDEYHPELEGLPGKDLDQIKAYLKNFDFAAARNAILYLAKRIGINLSPEHTGDHRP